LLYWKGYPKAVIVDEQALYNGGVSMISSKFFQGAACFAAMQLGGCIFLFDQNVCGDGETDQFEECDDGNRSNADGCLNTCEPSFCGDGFLQPQFEECDGGAGCDEFCNLIGNEFCGDNVQDAGEECDDGNLNDFDGCDSNCFVEQTGDVLFDYVLLAFDNGVVAASSCNDPTLPVPVSDIHFLLGDDFNGNSTLEDNEILQEAFSSCNQLDADNNGTLEQNEFGLFGETFFVGTFDLLAVEFLDVAGSPIGWQTFDANTDFTRFSFGGGITVPVNNTLQIPFIGDGSQVDSELQAFFGF
jgi:cysteine-rich repeat protein